MERPKMTHQNPRQVAMVAIIATSGNLLLRSRNNHGKRSIGADLAAFAGQGRNVGFTGI
jgi:hypothetical protein